MSQFHIVHGVLSLDVGGLERIVLDLARVGQARGHRISVVCIEGSGHLASQVEAAGATVVSLDKPPGRVPKVTNQAAALFAKLQPDVLHTHTIGALWYLGPAVTNTIPVLHTEHIDHVDKAFGWWAKFKMRVLWNRASRYCGRFCCVSDDIAASARRWGTVAKSKVEVVLNGIDTDRYTSRDARDTIRTKLEIPPEARVIGTVGRLNEVKRQDLLLRAVAKLDKKWQNVRVILVGDGPERVVLERLTAELGLSSRTHFVGNQSAPEDFLAAMDIFALTSRLEGLPLALLEAWAAGLPVVSSAVGGIPKVVQDGETGLLFPSGDEAALVAALQRLLTDSDLSMKIATAGQQLVAKGYSLERMADDYERKYRELIALKVGTR